MSKRCVAKRCKHGHRGKSWGQAWSLKHGFVYGDELCLATEVHCMICGAVLDEPLPAHLAAQDVPR